jgi:hypothetical protein
MSQEKPKLNKNKIAIKGVLDGSILLNHYVNQQLPFALFLAFLAVIYIGNRYSTERLVKDIATMQADIKELRHEAIATASELMFRSKQSVIAAECKKRGLGIEEATEPPVVLRLDRRGKLKDGRRFW